MASKTREKGYRLAEDADNEVEKEKQPLNMSTLQVVIVKAMELSKSCRYG